MDIKVARYEDYERIAQLHAKNWQLHYGEWLNEEMTSQDLLDDRLVIWQTRLINPALNQHVLILEEHGKLCGFACAFGNHDFEKGSLIDSLHIEKQYLGQGLSRVLLSKMSEWLGDYFAEYGAYLSGTTNIISRYEFDIIESSALNQILSDEKREGILTVPFYWDSVRALASEGKIKVV